MVHAVVAAEGLPVATRVGSASADDVRVQKVPAFLLVMAG